MLSVHIGQTAWFPQNDFLPTVICAPPVSRLELKIPVILHLCIITAGSRGDVISGDPLDPSG